MRFGETQQALGQRISFRRLSHCLHCICRQAQISSEPVHQYRVHGIVGDGADTLLDGQSRSVFGQRCSSNGCGAPRTTRRCACAISMTVSRRSGCSLREWNSTTSNDCSRRSPVARLRQRAVTRWPNVRRRWRIGNRSGRSPTSGARASAGGIGARAGRASFLHTYGQVRSSPPGPYPITAACCRQGRR